MMKPRSLPPVHSPALPRSRHPGDVHESDVLAFLAQAERVVVWGIGLSGRAVLGALGGFPAALPMRPEVALPEHAAVNRDNALGVRVPKSRPGGSSVRLHVPTAVVAPGPSDGKVSLFERVRARINAGLIELAAFDSRAEVLASFVPSDTRSESGSQLAVRSLASERELLDALNAKTLLVVSPGVSLTHCMRAVMASGARLSTDLELGLAAFFGRVALVTGTNGKSTVTALLGAIVKAGATPAFVGGNLGIPTMALWSFAHREDPAAIAVIEASSYQLEYAPAVRADAAVLTSFSEDHLARHHTLSGYGRAKLQALLALPSGVEAVVSGADPAAVALARASGRPLHMASGRDLDALETGHGCFFVGHDRINAACAVRVARHFGLSVEAIRAGIAAFRPLPHRLATVGEAASVRFINDSKATNVGAAVAAIQAVAGRGALTVLVGGSEKGGSYAPLIAALRAHAQRTVLVGNAAPRLAAALEANALPFLRASDLATATVEAAEAAAEDASLATISSATVLLAPACASFDAFNTFEARGSAFEAAAHAWLDMHRSQSL